MDPEQRAAAGDAVIPRRNPLPAIGLAVGLGAGALLAWEGAWWMRRRARRTSVFERARAEARAIGRPLVVIGAPDRGATAGYPCGDITIDIGPSACPRSLTLDITRPLPIADDSVVVFCSCVLEYVADVGAALVEIARVSGGHAYFVGVEPWTLTALLYPGARRTMAPHLR